MRRLRGSGSWTRPGAVIAAAAVGALLVGLGSAHSDTPTDRVALAHAGAPAGMARMPGMAGMAMSVALTVPGRIMLADAPAASNAITIQNFAFAPETATVKVGTPVTWTNKDTDPHTVTSMNNGPLHSQPLNTGDTYRYTFTTPGRYDYLCTIHPFMTATVVVTP
ncbi:MAG TPA: cupredoxin family copper-binding protein [Pseudonocardia sp.]|jgi:plastocyanin